MLLSRASQGYVSVWRVSLWIRSMLFFTPKLVSWSIKCVRLFHTPSAQLCDRLQASSSTEKWLDLKADHMLIWSICAYLHLCVYIHMYQILINKIRQWSKLELSNSRIVVWLVICYSFHACQWNVFSNHTCISNCPSINPNGLERNRLQGAYSYHSTLTLCSISVHGWCCLINTFLTTISVETRHKYFHKGLL